MKKHILFILLFATILSSCSIEKRIYQPGYFISGRNSSTHEIAVPKRTQPIFIEENKTSNESICKSGDTTKLDFKQLKIDSSESNISEISLLLNREKEQTNFIQNTKIKNEPLSDSIPDEGKILLAKYEKNHKTKNKIREIAFYPIVLFLIVFAAFLLLIIPWLFYVIYDSIMIALIRICVAAVILVIPFAIISLILSIITKKQRRKLRQMGLVK